MKLFAILLILCVFVGGAVCENEDIPKIGFKNRTVTLEINDTVYINTPGAYIESYPHTIFRSDYVYINFTIKKYRGMVDCYVGVNDTTFIKNISIYNNGWEEMDNRFDIVDHVYNKKDVWHKVARVLNTENTTIRMWIDIDKNTKSGKYDFGICPAEYSLQDAMANKCFYVLDPFYKTWYVSGCPRGGEYPCNKTTFIDLKNGKYLYLQTSYLCGDVNGDGYITGTDVTRLYQRDFRCSPPIINYKILDYFYHVGKNIIKPRRSIYD